MRVSQLTPFQKDKVLEIFMDFVNEQKPLCSESVLQVDRITLECPSYLAEMIEVVQNILDLEEQ